MSDFDTYPAVDAARMFPPSVRAAIAASPELLEIFAHLSGGVLTIDGNQVGEPSPVAGLDTVGWAKAVFIENEGTVPPGLDPYTIVIEQD